MHINGIKRRNVGTVRDRIARLLIDEGPHTFEEMATELGITVKQAKNAIYKERANYKNARKMFYIQGYKRNLKRPGKRGGGPLTPRWAFGSYPDRPMPDVGDFNKYHADACKRWYDRSGKWLIQLKRRKKKTREPNTFFSAMQSIVDTLLNRNDKK